MVLSTSVGALAQLGARHTGSVEVTGSNPVCSIEYLPTNFNTKMALQYGGPFLCIYLKMRKYEAFTGIPPAINNNNCDIWSSGILPCPVCLLTARPHSSARYFHFPEATLHWPNCLLWARGNNFRLWCRSTALVQIPRL